MTRDNQDALRLAESHQKIARMNGGIKSVFISQKSLLESSTHLRRLVAENEALRESVKKANEQAEHFEREWYLRGDQNEAKDALLRQAVEALDDARTFVGAWPAGAATTDAIRQHLEVPA